MKILLSASTGLGDFILKTPMIYLLGETFPNLSVDILVGNSWGVDQILANETNIQLQYFNLPKKKNFGALCKMFFSMRGNNYDYIILPYDATDRNLRWSALFFLKARFYLVHFSPRYKTLKGKAEALLLNFFSGNKIILVPVLKGHHEINANLDFARHIIDFPISSIGMRPKINPTPSTITNLNVGSNYIVIQPNAANGSQTPKVWNPDSFLELVQLLAAKYCDLKIVLVGDGGDRARLLEHALLKQESVLNLLGETNLGQLCQIIRGAKLVIAHDSSIAHIADSLDKPLVALYGPTDDSKSKVLGSKSKIIYSCNETLSLMYRTGLSEEAIAKKYPGYYCMSAITPIMVLEAIENYL